MADPVQVQLEALASEAGLTEVETASLRHYAERAVRSSGRLPGKSHSSKPRQILRASKRQFSRVEHFLYSLKASEPSDDLKTLYENLRLIRTDVHDLNDSVKFIASLPAVRVSGEAVPRSIVLARALAEATGNRLSENAFSLFIRFVQEIEPLRLSELWGMLPSLKLILLNALTEAATKAINAFREHGPNAVSCGVAVIISSLRLLGEIDWKERIEQLSLVHRILSLDPSGVYTRMDFDSREQYRQQIEKIASHSDVSELDLSRELVRRAQNARIEPSTPEALRVRLKHVGYYLFDELASQSLFQEIGFRPSFGRSLERLFHSFPDEIYIIGIESVTLITVVALIMSQVRAHGGFGLFISALLLLLPATQAAVEVMNYLVTTVLTPRPLPKLDYSNGVEPASATMVAIPTLLINEKQIRDLVEDLEVRYLVNRDPNVFYALLTDLPDTAEPVGEYDSRVDLAVNLINELNRKYGGEPYGGFYLFHRHRTYNPREGAWMGWERKRGKLLDLNQLLRKVYDPFPVKAGDLSRLPHIRYVLTLDSDTQLPRGAAQRLIGAMAHPLNRPLIDPDLNIVTQGYGILQPRVEISVHSATRSRLAQIYSGDAGLDIYSRAVSDVYQDLYGEGIFTGKGIYDVDALRAVLEHRFPRNALLSHDLIEGAYARAGLVSDVEVIDDYPTHYSAFNRRKHRWLRGDWQIARWVFNKVPDESRRLVTNPISLVSKWKILDNLRRSLIEPSTFLLLIAGWFFLPGGPGFWTLVTLALLFLPIYFRLCFSLVRAAWNRRWISIRLALEDFATAHLTILLNIAFLAHQTVVALDAITRTIVRSTITHTRLLEWETATEAELGIRKRTPVDIYLDWIWLPAVCLGLVLYFRPGAAPWAVPFIVAWCCSKLLSQWLNRSPHAGEYRLTRTDRAFLRRVALHTWRYFSAFSDEKNNWLIPDNVQEDPYRIAERISPTNLGFLLNSRQAALEFGYLSTSEFISLTEATLQSTRKLPRHFGHFANWYDTRTLQPLAPVFLSSVDSGNLVASLWSLKQGCLELLRRPVIREAALFGILDYYRALDARDRAIVRTLEEISTLREPFDWLPRVLRVREQLAASVNSGNVHHIQSVAELLARMDALWRDAVDFAPWYLPRFDSLRRLGAAVLKLPESVPYPATGRDVYLGIERQLEDLKRTDVGDEVHAAADELLAAIAHSGGRLSGLASRLQAIADDCDRLVRETDFHMLVDKRRKLLSVGYDVASNRLSKSCYDLLASESRTAAFVAIAKHEADQDVWFRLGRQHTVTERETVLISWTGTMFEYLMPVIWMKSHPNTLLDRAVRSAVRVHESYGFARRVPWGISEAAYSKRDEEGNYQYAAFGVPGLALNVSRAGSLVVSPYSSCLALLASPRTAVQNLRRMAKRHWFAEYGFYESADFTAYPESRWRRRKYELVRCWMAHHQGMSLAAICNLLHDSPFQRWFHAEPLVRSSELILQERPLRVRPMVDVQPRRVLAPSRNTPKDAVAKAQAH